ncbi:type II toxin-antitoxin system VapC family toxin [Pelagibacterium halotolerans]|uniref:type II toxin-antitoxin system VapC family toxin n=1 Tax=Pelagibacterium halotolerans TaxID=531813 RepID=UPI00384E053F
MMLLLDTNVVSELRKVRFGKAAPGVAAWSEGVDASDLYVSAITLMELELGILRLERKDADQGALLRAWMQSHVLPEFSERTLSVDPAVALRCAKLHVPAPMPERDALIAATAIVHGMAIVTRNIADFETTGVPIINPWDSSAQLHLGT